MRKLPLNKNTIILDTESTGLGDDDEIIEIAIINGMGDVLINTQFKPKKLIPKEAFDIHGITNDDVQNKRPWRDYISDIERILSVADDLIIYGRDFDIRMILQSSCIHECQFIYPGIKAHCAMHWYAEFYKEREVYKNGFKNQKLVNAAQQQGIDASNFKAHSALGDCQVTLELIRAVNKKLK